jgi:ATP-binding cassette subfamily B (MDR/TAP) protein 1
VACKCLILLFLSAVNIFLWFYYLLSCVYSGLNQAATNFYSFDQGRIAAYRLFEMISRSSSTVNQDGDSLVAVQGNIEFRNVYFSYLSRPEIPILSGFYLTVPAKKAVALVGRNGSGKSSIIPLMERFYDPTLGTMAILFLCCLLN